MGSRSQAVMHDLGRLLQGEKNIAKAHAEGWVALPQSGPSGLSGTYGVLADAYRELASELKPPIRPRVLHQVWRGSAA
jgi:hypothetical protein